MQIPRLSIVIVAVSGRHAITDCLRSLSGQCGTDTTEVIVIGCTHDGVGTHLKKIVSGAQILELERREPVPRMRRLGWEKAQGDIIAFTEDHCVPDAGWVARIRRAHQVTEGAIGGSIIAHVGGSRLDWAVYFCEYASYLAPAAGTARQLPGNNVSYKRKDFIGDTDLWASEVWETLLHRRLQEKGIPLIAEPEIIVYFRNRYRFHEFLRLRFHYGRCFAGRRIAGKAVGRRMLRAASSPLLPAVLLARMAGQARRRLGYVRNWGQALPWIFLFTLAWSIGEGVGYLSGPGDSCERT